MDESVSKQGIWPEREAPECVVAPLPGVGERRRYRGVVQPFAAHSHGHYVIGLAEEGRRSLICNGVAFELVPGDLAVFNPGDVHGCEQSDGGVFAYDSIAVDAELLDGVRLEGPKVGDPAVVEVFREVLGVLEDGAEAEVVEAVLCLCELLAVEEAEGDDPAASPLPGLHEDAAQRAMAHFCGHLAAPASLGALAADEGLSPYALIRAYKRRFAITPMRHLASLRVECACRLLREGVEPAAVAAEVGFADQAHLTRAFKQRLGTTPGAYQKMMGA
ncbi:AraC family transcriptional regulator [uncultured Adlercreutzia sp.]|mgnify:CR=1 FL=1|uniref:helix-turn-helix domain-containing protein n=1 Tax=uncultured Adlercreutzia sp. TaxID=875803 RepID=UPI002583E7ED|nr:AraC family transcriptional regulator [uncultured Adlercreutzia sp.]